MLLSTLILGHSVTDRRAFVGIVAGGLLLSPVVAHAQQPANKLPTLGILALAGLAQTGSSPQALLAQSTDWRFVNELKKELKG